jgi:hypothetical protein
MSTVPDDDCREFLGSQQVSTRMTSAPGLTDTGALGPTIAEQVVVVMGGGHVGRRSATRKSDSSVNGRKSQVDSNNSGENPASAASSRKWPNA